MDEVLTFLRGWGYAMLAMTFLYACIWVLQLIVYVLRELRVSPILAFIVVGLTVFVGSLIYLGLR